MRSTFMGLETAKRGMYTQQSALYTTGHNISNANTPGYSRQRINFQTTTPYPALGMNRPQIPGQMGTGVEAGSVQRIRDEFLDLQFRGQNNKLGYWDSKADALSQMESVMSEINSSGLSSAMSEFWKALEDVSVHPEDAGPRGVLLERGKYVGDTFKHLADSLTTIRTNLKKEVDVTKDQINSLASQINELNKQIADVEPHGYLPNDLYDKRDMLIDQLSGMVNIKVTAVPSGGNALGIAEGSLDIEIVDDTGANLFGGTKLVDGATKQASKIDITTTGTGDQEVVDTISLGGTSKSFTEFTSSGSFKGLIESYGYNDNGAVKGLYPDMMTELDRLAFTYVQKFNEAHQKGHGLAEEGGTAPTGNNFFDSITNVQGAAKSVNVSSAVIDDPNKIAASKDASGGDGSYALVLANISKEKYDYSGTGKNQTSFHDYYQKVTGEMAVNGEQANRLARDTAILQLSVDQNRQSISSVSMDEELTNMIKYQHAYNAAARNITVVDEMLDKIINGMGVVGR